MGTLALTEQDIKDIFTETQAARHQRAETVVSAAQKQQALMAYEKPLVSAFILKLLGPRAGD